MAGSNKVVVKFLADTDQMKRSLGSIDKGLKRFGKAAVGIGVAVAGAFAVKELAEFGKEAINLASDLEEASAKTQQVFGDQARVIEEASKQAARAAGLSENAYLSAASTLGIYADKAGLAGQAQAEFATGLTQVAADFASFYNTDVDQALSAIQQGLRGESEALRQYGVFLDDATLKQGYFAATGEEVSGTLTAQQKIIGAQNQIYEQGAVALDDYARTADGLANTQRTLSATFENLQTALGEGLLPIVSGLATALLPIVEELTPTFAELGKNLGEALAPALEAISKVLPPIANLFGILADVISGVLTTAINTLVPVFTSIVEKFGEFVTRIAPVAQRLIQALAKVFDALWRAVEPVLDVLLELAATLVEAAIPFIELLAEVLVNVIDAVVPLIRAIAGVSMALAPLQKAFTDLLAIALAPLIPLLTITIDVMAKGLTKAIVFVAKALGTQLVAWGKWAKSTTQLVGPTIEKLLGWAASLVEGFAFLPIVGDTFEGLGKNIRGAGASISSGLNAMGDAAIGAGTQLQALEDYIFDFEPAAKTEYWDSFVSVPADTAIKAEETGQELGRKTGSGAAKGAKESNPKFVEAIQEGLDAASKKFEEWRSKVVGWMDLGSAYDEANNAKGRLAELNEELADLRLEPDFDKEAEKKLLEQIDDAGRDAGKTWLDRFTQQITDAGEFSRQLGNLANSGLNQTLIQQIADMGPGAGSELASEIINGDAALVATLNNQASEIDRAGKDLGVVMANTGAPAGKKWATEFMWDDKKGLVAVIKADSKKVKKKIKNALKTEVEVKVKYVADFSQAGPAASASGIGATATIQNIQTYERLNGSKWRDRVR